VLEINDLKGQAARGPSLINPDSVGASQFKLKIVLHFHSHAPSLAFTENRSVRLGGDFTTSEHITCFSKLAVSQPNPNTASQIFFGTFPNLFWNHPAGSCTHTTLTQFISWYQYMKAVFSKYSSGYTPCRPKPKGRCLQYADGALPDLSECLVLRYQSRIRHTKVLF